MLRKSWNPEGDIPNEKGLSHFPGNTSNMLFSLEEYHYNLERTSGVVPEFVNPKYKDATKTEYTSATRLECMHTDYPKLIETTEK